MVGVGGVRSAGAGPEEVLASKQAPAERKRRRDDSAGAGGGSPGGGSAAWTAAEKEPAVGVGPAGATVEDENAAAPRARGRPPGRPRRALGARGGLAVAPVSALDLAGSGWEGAKGSKKSCAAGAGVGAGAASVGDYAADAQGR